jgi:hypothetical protein
MPVVQPFTLRAFLFNDRHFSSREADWLRPRKRVRDREFPMAS